MWHLKKLVNGNGLKEGVRANGLLYGKVLRDHHQVWHNMTSFDLIHNLYFSK